MMNDDGLMTPDQYNSSLEYASGVSFNIASCR